MQNIAQLAAVRDTRLREHTEISETEPVFGIATTFLTWQFLALYGDVVHVSELFVISPQNIEVGVPTIIGMVASMLRHGASLDIKNSEND